MIVANWVQFWHEVQPTEDGRFRYVILCTEHYVHDEEGAWATPEQTYETGPAFDTHEAAAAAGDATARYYSYLSTDEVPL
jgi:hypothetical protein